MIQVLSLRLLGQTFSIGTENGSSPVRHRAIIWSNGGLWYSLVMHAYAPPGRNRLTHCNRDKMAVIFQAAFSNAFSWMKMYKLPLRFHWSLFQRIRLTMFPHWLIEWLGAGQATSRYLIQWWFNYWRISASLGLNELTHWGWKKISAYWRIYIYASLGLNEFKLFATRQSKDSTWNSDPLPRAYHLNYDIYIYIWQGTRIVAQTMAARAPS